MMRLAAVAFALAAFIIPSAQGGGSAAFVRIFDLTTGVEHVDLGPLGESAGDLSIRGLRLYDRHDRVIGQAVLTCMALGRAVPGTSLCDAVYTLPKGRLVAHGTRRRSDYYVLPVTGGTGVYSHASGSLLAEKIAPRRERLLFSLES